jgi:hypothetical protein
MKKKTNKVVERLLFEQGTMTGIVTYGSALDRSVHGGRGQSTRLTDLK